MRFWSSELVICLYISPSMVRWSWNMAPKMEHTSSIILSKRPSCIRQQYKKSQYSTFCWVKLTAVGLLGQHKSLLKAGNQKLYPTYHVSNSTYKNTFFFFYFLHGLHLQVEWFKSYMGRWLLHVKVSMPHNYISHKAYVYDNIEQIFLKG